MRHLSSILALVVLVFLATIAPAADPPPLFTAQGTVEKVEGDSLTIRPRGPDGKFQKSVALKLTGTSKVATLAPQTRGGKIVLTQKDTDPKELQPQQAICVIYATVKEGSVLLTAVVHPPGEK